MSTLAVNVDHIATIREARKIDYPDPVIAAGLAEIGGADGVVVHLRGDRRHIQERDIEILRKTVQTKLILEMANTKEMLEFALKIKPELVTLVPEREEEISTEGGLDVLKYEKKTKKAIKTLQKANIPVSIFIDPNEKQIGCAKKLDADMIEIHTGSFCDEKNIIQKESEFKKIINSANFAKNLNIGVNVGHGLCYNTIKKFKGYGELFDEFSIGHSIVSRAVFVGFENAVKEMARLIENL